ncbi:MAG TPA: hypothetical protein ENK21_05460 [Trueperaceae bacterium]|nr:hypothetical protein [Trueperaceae bacterium]
MSDLRVVEDIVAEYYGFQARAYPLVGYDDLNFKLETNSAKYVLKLSQAELSDLEFENEIMLYLYSDFGDIIPQLIAAKNKSFINSVSLNGQEYLMRMISFCRGSSLHSVNNPSPKLIDSFATSLAKIDKKLFQFSHPNQSRYIAWDAKYSLKNINLNKKYLSKTEQELIDYYLNNHLKDLEQSFIELRQSIIHNDANDYNILVDSKEEEITAIIDFGDSVKTYLVNELAIACTYLMISNAKPFELAAGFVASYNQALALKEIEIENLYSFIILRLCLSVTMSAKASQDRPTDNYINVSQKDAWQFLKTYAQLDQTLATDYLKEKINV